MKKCLVILVMMVLPFMMYGVNDTIVQTSKTDVVLADGINKFINMVDKTGVFVLEQAPLVIQEFFTWRIFLNIVGIICGIGVFFIGRYLPYTWLNKESESSYDSKFFSRYGDDGWVFAMVVFVCCCIASIATLVISFIGLMQIIIAPKLYLIEYFTCNN